MTTRIIAVVPLVVLCLVAGPTVLPAQGTDDFVELFNGRNLDGWTVENSTAGNFTVQDGVLRVEGPQGWLRSNRQYADFTLQVDVRFLTSDADSGVFLRAPGPVSNIFIRGWPANAYQVQVRDMSVNRTDNPFWAGNLYRHRVAQGETQFDRDAALGAIRPTGEWQQFEIQATGDRITARINGVHVLDADNVVNPSGFIGVQGETGALEFRRIAIRERTTTP